MKTLIFIISILFFVNIFSQSWFIQESGTSNTINDIYFLNSNSGFASCDNGVLLKTTNGGNNWIAINSSFSGNLINVRFFDINTGLVFSNSIYKTINGGLNWTQVANLPGYLHHCVIADDNTIYGCEPFRLTKSSNRGDNWIETPSTPAWITTALYFNNTITGWVATVQPTITPPFPQYAWSKLNKTQNGADSWTAIYTDYALSGTNNIYDVFFPVPDTGYFIGKSGGSVYRTYNGGVNWNEIALSGGLLYELYFITCATGWGCGSNGVIYKTSDAGVNWLYNSSPVTSQLNGIYFINSMTGWAAGNNGVIIKSTNGGFTNINYFSNIIPEKFSLSQNYPNPFNPSTMIRFDVPSLTRRGAGVVVLKVYDALGREVQTLVNEQLQPGTYEVDFDGSNFSSGVYYYTLSAGNYIITKKMVLIK